MAPAGRTHGAIQAELARLIGNALAEKHSPCSVVSAPGVVPRVRAGANLRVPDLGVVCGGDASEEPVLTEPVLLIEILSPSNESRTRANVWTYTTIPSVKEIAVFRSADRGAEILRRGPDGNWPAAPQAIEGGEAAFESVGVRFPLEAAYRTTRLGSALTPAGGD